jgi:hypothetical protein
MIQKKLRRLLYDLGTIAYPVGDRANMLIRQVRSLGSLRKELVSMSPSWRKPEDSFGAPTYKIGGSNFSLHGRVGLFFIRLVVTTLIPFWRVIDKRFMIESRRKIFIKCKSFIPPKALALS